MKLRAKKIRSNSELEKNSAGPAAEEKQDGAEDAGAAAAPDGAGDGPEEGGGTEEAEIR